MHWPRGGTGGVAELYHSPFLPYQVGSRYHITQKQILQMRLLVARDYLDRLASEGGRACFPGIWYIAHLQANRTTREFAGKLYGDAYNDLIILEDQVNDLKHRFEYVQRHGVCRAQTRVSIHKRTNKVERIAKAERRKVYGK